MSTPYLKEDSGVESITVFKTGKNKDKRESFVEEVNRGFVYNGSPWNTDRGF